MKLRVLFAIYMTWFLVGFIPTHTRGAITIGPKSEGAVKVATGGGCCAKCPSTGEEKKPSEADKKSCAVCHWAAGLLPIVPFVFELDYLLCVTTQAVGLSEQYFSVEIPRDVLPRGPPGWAWVSSV